MQNAPWTPKQEEELLNLWRDGFGIDYISKSLDRTPAAIATRLTVLDKLVATPRGYVRGDVVVTFDELKNMQVRFLAVKQPINEVR